jgi:drug/metabolite transporter (DMT)-like permease
VLILALPACCDIAGTTLMNVGLFFVAASIYQMTRGALVLFVGLFSVLFLRRRLRADQWLALVLVVLGVGLVGLAGALFRDHRAVPSSAASASSTAATTPTAAAAVKAASSPASSTTSLASFSSSTLPSSSLSSKLAAARSPDAVRTSVGIVLIAFAQVFTATQFVLEEWILEHYALAPIKVVGWEGMFGLGVTLFGMAVMHAAVGRTPHGRYGYFDAREGWRQMTQYPAIGISSILIMISIGYEKQKTKKED